MAKLEEKVAEQGRRLESLDSRIFRLEQKNSIAPPKKGGGQVQDLTGGKGRQGGLSSQVSGSHFPASTKDMPTSITRTLASEVLETRGGTLRLPESCIEVTVFCQDWPCLLTPAWRSLAPVPLLKKLYNGPPRNPES